METAIIYSAEKVHHEIIRPSGAFPNNSRLPVLLYKSVLELPGLNDAAIVDKIFEANKWSNSWIDGIYEYHHFHSITHEVIGVTAGDCILSLGGVDENQYHIEKGDVLILPAGVAHRRITSSKDFQCVGAYPGGAEYDIKRGRPDEKAEAENHIRKVAIPHKDPVYGKGPLQKFWK